MSTKTEAQQQQVRDNYDEAAAQLREAMRDFRITKASYVADGARPPAAVVLRQRLFKRRHCWRANLVIHGKRLGGKPVRQEPKAASFNEPFEW